MISPPNTHGEPNLHASNERIKLDTIQTTSDVYSTAMHSLLASGTAAPNA